MSTAPSAGELVEQARTATSIQELDAIEAQAAGRVTVENAVAQRRMELEQQSATEQPVTGEQPAVQSEQVQGEPTPYGEPGGVAPGTDNPGDISDPQPANQMFQAVQVDPPLGPYPDPPLGPYPDPVAKEPIPPEEPIPPPEEPTP